MGKLKEKIDSLKNKYQIHNLENDTYRIIQNLEHLDELGKIKSLDELNEIYKKIEHLLMLEAEKTERKINEKLESVAAFNDKAFEKLGINDNTPSFADAVREAGGNIPMEPANNELSFEEAVKKAREKSGIPEPKPFNPDLSFAEAIEKSRRTHK